MRYQAQIMYLENKTSPSGGYARIGKVELSQSGTTLRYKGKAFKCLNKSLSQSNYFDIETGELYWISNCKKDGQDRENAERHPVYIDENIREEYWLQIRNQPNNKNSAISNL
ncbi:MAG: hypothetical protein ACPGJS_21455 [Flammeovirgaceae bacterium]